MRPISSHPPHNAAKSLLARFWRCDRGSNAIEFAAVAPIIIVILLATAQIAVIFIAQSYMEALAEQAMRIVLTNQANNLTQTQFNAAICADITALFNCNNLIVALEEAPTSASGMAAAMPQFNSDGSLANPTTYAIVPAPNKMLLIVMYEWPVISGPLGMVFGGLGNGNYLLVSTHVFQIEPST
jgi:Flp pilus assembly protein TadG